MDFPTSWCKFPIVGSFGELGGSLGTIDIGDDLLINLRAHRNKHIMNRSSIVVRSHEGIIMVNMNIYMWLCFWYSVIHEFIKDASDTVIQDVTE